MVVASSVDCCTTASGSQPSGPRCLLNLSKRQRHAIAGFSSQRHNSCGQVSESMLIVGIASQKHTSISAGQLRTWCMHGLAAGASTTSQSPQHIALTTIRRCAQTCEKPQCRLCSPPLAAPPPLHHPLSHHPQQLLQLSVAPLAAACGAGSSPGHGRGTGSGLWPHGWQRRHPQEHLLLHRLSWHGPACGKAPSTSAWQQQQHVHLAIKHLQVHSEHRTSSSAIIASALRPREADVSLTKLSYMCHAIVHR